MEQEGTIAERNQALKALQAAVKQRDSLQEEMKNVRRIAQDAFDKLHNFGEGPPFVPNGHFYSPIPSLKDLERDKDRVLGHVGRSLPGIDLKEDAQFELLKSFSEPYKALPFSEDKVEGLRYFYRNPAYGHSDAIFLNLMIRHSRPKTVIEIGSGFSSCMLLDTNELWFGNSIECTFIEPYPELLYSLLETGDSDRIDIISVGVQEVNLARFEKLQANDVLFVDSTHVGKFGSDVNHIIFNVLPALASGVFVHFHDIFYPFEYPEAWIREGRAWNEAYLLRAFLQHNSTFEIMMFNTFMQQFHRGFFEEHMPLCLKNSGGSIWLRKR